MPAEQSGRYVSSPEMIVAISSFHFDLQAKDLRQPIGLQNLLLAPVCYDSSLRHKDDAVDLGNNVRKVVCYQDDSNAGLRQLAHCFAKRLPGEQVKGVAGLIEEQRLRLVNEGARYQHSPRFA